jgi:hypothetical protein
MLSSLPVIHHHIPFHSMPDSTVSYIHELMKEQEHSKIFPRIPWLLSEQKYVLGKQLWGPVLQTGRSRIRFLLWTLGIFNLHNPTNRTMALSLTQPLTEISTRNLLGGGGERYRRGSWHPRRHLWADCLENVGFSTSHNPICLYSLLQE